MQLPDFDLSYLPFVSLATAKANEHIHRPLFTRVIEGVIMGIAGGALGTYVTVHVLSNDIQWIKTTITAELAEIKQDIRVIENRQFESRK